MKVLSDGSLGEALWERSKISLAQGDYYNATLDLSAAYRLLSLAEDPRLEKVRIEWETCYEALASHPAPQVTTPTTQDSKLESLLKKVTSRKQGTF